MEVMAFNGSPRKKKWNKVTLLESALQGALQQARKPNWSSFTI